MTNEITEMWRDARRRKQQQHYRQSKANIGWLDQLGVGYTFNMANGQAVIDTPHGKLDYWTTTGKWFDRKQHQYGRGRDGIRKRVAEYGK